MLKSSQTYLSLNFKNSYKNLYNLIRDSKEVKLPQNNLLFSKQIQSQKITNDMLSLNKELNFDIKKSDDTLKSIEPQENYKISKKQYLNYISESKHGNINLFKIQDTKYNLIGTQYEFLPLKNVYKIIQNVKPDAIILPLRPDTILKNFDVHPKQKDRFSNRKYFEQLTRYGFELMPNQHFRNKVQFELKENNILYKDIQIQDEEFHRQNALKKQYKSYEVNEKINLDSIAACCFYAERHDIPVILGGLPEIIFRQNIVNQFTLMQLQNIFTKCSRSIAQFPDLQPQNPLIMAYYLYPEIFLEFEDKYMATILYYMGKDYKNILNFTGLGQSLSQSDIMENRTINAFDEELKIVPVDYTNNSLQKLKIEELVEKHSILDVMYYGKDIFKNIEDKRFKTTLKIIQKYSDSQNIDRNLQKKMHILHFKLLEKYSKFCQESYRDGKKDLETKFLNQVIE